MSNVVPVPHVLMVAVPDADGVHSKTCSGALAVAVFASAAQVLELCALVPEVVPAKVPPVSLMTIGLSHVPVGRVVLVVPPGTLVLVVVTGVVVDVLFVVLVVVTTLVLFVVLVVVTTLVLDVLLVVLVVVTTLVLDVLLVVTELVVEVVLVVATVLLVDVLTVLVVVALGGMTVRLKAPCEPPHEPANPSTMTKYCCPCVTVSWICEP